MARDTISAGAYGKLRLAIEACRIECQDHDEEPLLSMHLDGLASVNALLKGQEIEEKTAPATTVTMEAFAWVTKYGLIGLKNADNFLALPYKLRTEKVTCNLAAYWSSVALGCCLVFDMLEIFRLGARSITEKTNNANGTKG